MTCAQKEKLILNTYARHITVTLYLRVTCAHSIRGGVEEMEECGKEQDEDTVPVDFFCQVVILMTTKVMMMIMTTMMMTMTTIAI